MQILRPSAAIVPYGLRAMKMVASADGVFGESERALIATAQSFFGIDVNVNSLPPIEPAELAQHVTDPAFRRQLVRGMVVMSLVDGEATPAEASTVERFATSLEIESEDVKALRSIADKHLLRARFDIARRFFAADKAREYARENGIAWVASTLAALAGVREDTKTADRYRALKEAPEGSLGRGYADFIAKNQFTFPGEKGSPPEFIALHDLTHVLSGYGTNPEGELQVLGFHAGCQREEKDPSGFLMFGIAEFHLGLAMSPVATGSRGKLDPVLLFKAIERGSKCTMDPTDGWDPWAVMNEPLEDLRTRYGITSLAS